MNNWALTRLLSVAEPISMLRKANILAILSASYGYLFGSQSQSATGPHSRRSRRKPWVMFLDFN